MEEILAIQNPWWENRSFKTGILRQDKLALLKETSDNNRVTMLLGGRRVGKTYLIYQYIQALLEEGIKPQNILYILLDTQAFKDITIQELIRNYKQIHNLGADEKIFIFLDEIQYKKDWEQEIKNIYDTQENIRVLLSGSASFKIHTKTAFLTGRYGIMYLFPLTFSEWLVFKNILINPSENYKYPNEMKEYFIQGGYPEYVTNEDPQYFSNLIDSIVYKDFVEYYNIKNLDIVKDLFKLLADRTGSHASLTKLGNILSKDKETVRDYIYALKGSFSVYELQRFSTSRNDRIYFPKKYYLNDNGLQFNLEGKLNKGQAAERTLFDYLSKKFKESLYFYYDAGTEADFIVNRNNNLTIIESKYINSISEFNSDSLLKAMVALQQMRAIVITESLEQEYIVEERLITFIPLWKVLTNDNIIPFG